MKIILFFLNYVEIHNALILIIIVFHLVNQKMVVF